MRLELRISVYRYKEIYNRTVHFNSTLENLFATAGISFTGYLVIQTKEKLICERRDQIFVKFVLNIKVTWRSGTK